jgi:uncharacterized phiE125 gp8 family phage protein
MRLRCVIPPYAEPVDLKAVQAQCKVSEDDFKAELASMISVATAEIEGRTDRQLVCATFDYFLDAFPAEIILPRSPLVSVTSITYQDTAGTSQTLATTVYQVDTDAIPPVIRLKYQQSWPATYDQANCITVRFVAGHAAPFTVVAATDVLTATGRVFTNDDLIRLTNSGGALPEGFATLTDYYVLVVTGSTFQISASQDGAAVNATTTGEGTHYIVVPATQADFLRCQQAILLRVQDMFYEREANEHAIRRLLSGPQVNWL